MQSKCCLGCFLCVLMIAALFGCSTDDSKSLTPDQQAIRDGTYELFTRVKVGDIKVVYDNEFPCVWEDRTWDEYAQHPWIQNYRHDTLQAIQIDSVQVEGDTGRAFMKVEYILSDSSLSVDTIRLRWVKVGTEDWMKEFFDEQWIKPSLSRAENQITFEDELRVYYNALRDAGMLEEKPESGDGE